MWGALHKLQESLAAAGRIRNVVLCGGTGCCARGAGLEVDDEAADGGRRASQLLLKDPRADDAEGVVQVGSRLARVIRLLDLPAP
jgi:hypothetical protein